MSLTEPIRITDVAPRDGLQNEPTPVSTDDKQRLVELVAATGVDEVEVSSFVSPKWIPQLADAAELFARLADRKPPGCCFSALVPNEKGMAAAITVNRSAGRRLIDKVAVFTAASETFARRNINATIAESLERFVPVIEMARAEGLSVRAYISCMVRCPFEGPTLPGQLAQVAARIAALEVDEIDLGETIGAGTPQSIDAALEAVIAVLGPDWTRRTTLHLHQSASSVQALIEPALQRGIRSFDASAGGLGGCPYASTPTHRAPGNISTIALLDALTALQRPTRVDAAKVAAASTFAQSLIR